MPFQTVRDPLLSLFQSAAASVARRRSAAGTDITMHPLSVAVTHLALARTNPAQATTPPAGATPEATTCAGLGLELLEALVAGNQVRRQELQNRLGFSQCDPLWAETLIDYASDLGPDGRPEPIPYIRYREMSDFVLPAPAAEMRIGLIADWGTGTDEARQVAALLAQQQPDAVIHLGDIYYAGTAEECDAHFLTPLRAVLPDTPLFSLCGNHDVYSGGKGYYGLLGRIGQPASYFCLRSPDNAWQILAADTGLHDRDPLDEAAALTFLEPEEELWHADKLRGFPGRTMFLTHHQPFSAFSQIGPAAQHSPVNPNLMASHARLMEAGRIDAWFWGHEHDLKIYAPYRGVKAGRDIGFGAIPVTASPNLTVPLAGLLDPPALMRNLSLDVVDGAYTHGFALLDLRASATAVSYWMLTRPDWPIFQEILDGGPAI